MGQLCERVTGLRFPSSYLTLGDPGSTIGIDTSIGVYRSDATGIAPGNGLNLHGAADGIMFRIGGNNAAPPTPSMVIVGNTHPEAGNVGIGTTTPTALLEVGSATCNGTTWNNASSRDYKEEIRPIENPLALLEKVKVYRYRYRVGSDHRERIGVVAEELPDEVSTLDHKGAPTGELIALSLATNRALAEKVKQLEAANRSQAQRLLEIERLLNLKSARTP